MLLKKEQFWQRIQKKQIDPVYLIYGEEEFLVREAVERIKVAFLGPDAAKSQAHFLYSDEVSMDKLMEFALTLPFGNPKRVISYRLLSRPKSADKDIVSSYLNRPVKNTILVFTSEEADLASGFFKYLKEKAVVVRFYPLFENQIPEWIRRYASQIGVEITQSAAQILADLVGSDLSLLANEIQKISLYLHPKNRIDLKDVKESVGNLRMFSIFELTKCIGQKKPGDSLLMLRRLIDAGQSHIGLIALIAKHFQRLRQVSLLIDQGKQQAEIAKCIGVPAFFLKDYIQQARLFNKDEIDEFLRLLLDADLKLKSSALSHDLILDAFIFRLCSSSASKSISF
ncbi:DNA polymerase III subunit delta [bacterium]|nr:DNA polymerase III subunit delta [bacterium]